MPSLWTVAFATATMTTILGSKSMFSQALSQKSSSPIYVFCFGDSLTAGTSPPEFSLHPYGPHLEKTLREKYDMTSAVVRWKGLPGWTSGQMVDALESESAGLVHFVRNAPPLALAIILAGSNDLAYENEDAIVNNIWRLHSSSHELGVPTTLAIGIPSSGYQQVSPPAMQKAQSVNAMLKEKCEASQGRCKYVDFPFGFERNDDKWAPDGLHFSAKGYQVLGQGLAETVNGILGKKEPS